MSRLPLWKMMDNSSVGMIFNSMKFPNWMESHNPFMFQSTNQMMGLVAKIIPSCRKKSSESEIFSSSKSNPSQLTLSGSETRVPHSIPPVNHLYIPSKGVYQARNERHANIMRLQRGGLGQDRHKGCLKKRGSHADSRRDCKVWPLRKAVFTEKKNVTFHHQSVGIQQANVPDH